MEKPWEHDIIDRIQSDQELVAEFTSNMQLITKQTWVELIIDTSRKWIAWMKPGETKVFFNPIYTLKLIQAIQEQRAKEFWIFENFKFDINHLSQLVLHEINHMINHTNLKMSDKKVKINGKKLNMVEYEDFLHMKYWKDFHNFENILEDIDVNNHATMIQAPVFEWAKQDIYHHITAPSADFSEDTLAEQFVWAILRESMLPNEKCIVDPRVRACIDYLSEPWEALEKLRDPNLKYDEQLPIIHRLYEEYYLKFKKEDEKNEEWKIKNEEWDKTWDNQWSQQNQESQQENQDQNWQSGQWSNQWEPQWEQQWEWQQQRQQQWEQQWEWQWEWEWEWQWEWQPQWQQGSNSQSNSWNEDSEQSESWNNNWESNQKGGILWKLRDRLRQALWGKKWEKKPPFDKGSAEWNDAEGFDNEENKIPSNKWDNPENKNSSTESKQNSQDSSEWERSQQWSQYRPWKPMLLPHIFENLDEEWNSLLEQIEQSLKWWNDSKEQIPPTPLNKGGNPEDGGIKSQKIPLIQETLQQAIQEALQQQMEDENKSPEERSLEAMILQEWDIDGTNKEEMRDIKNAIKRQEQLKQQIKKIKDSKWQSVYDKITKDIFSRIVQIRKRNKLSERHARPFSEWGQLDSQSLVSGIMDRKAGDNDPRILQQEYKEQKEKQKAGWFSITFILDGSGSMAWERNKQQALSTLLMLYSLQQLNQDIKLEWWDMEDFLISTQAMMFCGSGQVALLKDRWQELNMKDIIEVTNALWYCDWWDTNAGDAINEYYKQVSKPFGRMSQKQYDERKEKVKSWKLKEIVFVLSDGKFNSWKEPRSIIRKLREMWIIVCGIWITDDWYPILDYFGQKSGDEEKDKQWFGIVCEDAWELGNTLNELLVQHLEDPSIVG